MWKATLGGDEVVASGTLVSAQGEPILLSPFGDTDPFTIEFAFVDDGGEQDIRGEVQGATLKLTLINFVNPFGTAVTEPMVVGKKAGGELRLTFFVHAVGDGPRARLLAFRLRRGAPSDG